MLNVLTQPKLYLCFERYSTLTKNQWVVVTQLQSNQGTFGNLRKKCRIIVITTKGFDLQGTYYPFYTFFHSFLIH